MVIYSERASKDLEDILYGLVTWKKHPLELDHARNYLRDIRKECDILASESYHLSNKNETLIEFGDKRFIYKRNKHTQWNVIYELDKVNQLVFINKIINNYLLK